VVLVRCCRTLTTWHCPRSPAVQQSIDISCPPRPGTAANLQQPLRAHSGTDGQTDERTPNRCKSTTNRSCGIRGLQLTDLRKAATTRRLSYGCRQQARPSTTTTTTNVVDNAIDLPWRNFPEFGVQDKVPEGSTLIFGDDQISLQHSVG